MARKKPAPQPDAEAPAVEAAEALEAQEAPAVEAVSTTPRYDAAMASRADGKLTRAVMTEKGWVAP